MDTETLKHNGNAFKVGERVLIYRKVETADGWFDVWGGGRMDSCVGQQGVVEDIGNNGIAVRSTDGQLWFYPSCALELVTGDKKAADVQEAPAHNQSAFKVGDLVNITRVLPSDAKVTGWAATWNSSGMDKYAGTMARVTEAGGRSGTTESLGYNLENCGGYWWPSVVLEKVEVAVKTVMLAQPEVKTALAVVDAATGAPVAKPKRVRIKSGPWDAAPCTHLRFMLMGFFRDKLALVKAPGGSEAVEVACTRCNVKMTMKAK